MYLPRHLTPFSRSILLTSMQVAHRRHVQHAGLASVEAPTRDARSWDDRPLVLMISGLWDQPPARVAQFLGAPVPQGGAGGKPARAARVAAALLAEWPQRQQRQQKWVEHVAAMQWSQAQLLQVMEEIEPYVADALFDEQRLAAVAVGSYATLLDMLQRRVREAGMARLHLVAGLPEPEAALVGDVAAGLAPGLLWQRHGHRGGDELELAAPRLGELRPAWPAAMEPPVAWQPAAAAQRRQQAADEVLRQVGVFHRKTVGKVIELSQAALVAHGQARDTLARVLTAVRLWSQAAAREGLQDGRLSQAGELYCLELEEIKQMMTGEWHSRDHIQPLVAARMGGQLLDPTPGDGRALGVAATGVAGEPVLAPAWWLDRPEDMGAAPYGAIFCATTTTAAWAPVFLRAGGIITTQGNWLGHTAAVARAGGLPAVVGVGSLPPQGAWQAIRLDPARDRVEVAA